MPRSLSWFSALAAILAALGISTSVQAGRDGAPVLRDCGRADRRTFAVILDAAKPAAERPLRGESLTVDERNDGFQFTLFGTTAKFDNTTNAWCFDEGRGENCVSRGTRELHARGHAASVLQFDGASGELRILAPDANLSAISISLAAEPPSASGAGYKVIVENIAGIERMRLEAFDASGHLAGNLSSEFRLPAPGQRPTHDQRTGKQAPLDLRGRALAVNHGCGEWVQELSLPLSQESTALRSRAW